MQKRNPILIAMKTCLSLLLIFALTLPMFSQEVLPNGGGEFISSKASNCLSPQEREEIKLMLEDNKKSLLDLKSIIKTGQEKNLIVAFDWPLQKANGLSFNSYYGVSNFVDQNSNSGLLDYNCSERTYDGHNGTDIFTWPFPWYLYDNNSVEVIAGTNGVIIGKDEGNDDDHCECSGIWNAVYIQHSDGSVAWYGHLKKNSVTTKSIGQSVSKGEYLGVVASSGCSTGPHLHFEVYDNSNNLIDPYSGNCNSLNGNTWWSTQPAFREPTLNALLTHDAEPQHGCAGVNEVPNISNTFMSGETIYFATYYHDRLNGDIANLKVKRPDGSVWDSWDHTSNDTYTAAWWYWTRTLPTNGPFGDWTFEVTYNSETFQHEFEYFDVLPVELIAFKGEVAYDNTVQLNWQTVSEVNNDGFELQRSSNGNSWEVISFIQGQGDSQEIKRYEYFDRTPFTGKNYYRLKQIDIDGGVEYSDIVNVNIEGKVNLSLYPNPTSDFVYVDATVANKLKVYDSFGRLVLTGTNVSKVDISNFPNGLYLFSIEGDNQTLVRKILKTE